MSELFEKLREYADSDYLPMHMPGHKRSMGELGNPFFIDITEIDGFDNLHHAEGILLEAQERAAKLYGSEETHYLVNGSTAGILAAVSGCTTFGGKILMARNSHKSAYHAVMLRGLHTHYIYPQSLENMGINGPILAIDVEKALKDDREIQAVLITSPTYDGVVSDVERIAEVVHQYHIPLIVDEAHGAHFPFSAHFPKDSVACGADVVIHSLHKTMPSLTQTALIHLNGSLVNRENIRKYLAIYQTSSPSYVLMASMDECVEWTATHAEDMEKFWERLCVLRKGLLKMQHLQLLDVSGMDASKILVSVQQTGISGRELSRILRETYHIELEMACSTYVCAITTVGDTEESMKRLLTAFLEIDQQIGSAEKSSRKRISEMDTVLPAEAACTIFEAEEIPKENCPLEEAVGRVSGEFIHLYPPGIPILAPGERISSAIAERIRQYLEDGFDIYGMDGGKLSVLKKE